jgi:hypothetical protein
VTARRHFGSIRKLPSGQLQAGHWYEDKRQESSWISKEGEARG